MRYEKTISIRNYCLWNNYYYNNSNNRCNCIPHNKPLLTPMKHSHKEECKHEKLTYCKECDVVECECGREWKTIGSWTTGIVKSDYTTTGGNAVCGTCYGSGTIAAPCPDGKAGCLVYHSQPCPNCKK